MERAGSRAVIRNKDTEEAFRNNSPLQEDSLPQIESRTPQDPQARRYEATKLALGLIQTLIFFLFTIIIVATGITKDVERWVRLLTGNEYAVLLGFASLIGATESVLSFPLKFYSGFSLEHRYHLSTQTLKAWLWDGAKGMMVGLAIGLPLLVALFACLRTFGGSWWIPVGILLFLVSVVLARLAPILIFPLFYSFHPVGEGPLRERILRLCDRAGVKVTGIFSFDMSKNTKKANAAFTGIGRSKRIILGDTLLSNFTDDEIEAVFAHELGHYTMNHIWIMMAVGAASTFAGLFLTSLAYSKSLVWFGFPGVDSIAAMPLLGLWLGLYSLVTSPLGNALSRSHEYAADRYAVQTIGNSEAFSRALNKLAVVNLADLSPNRVVEFLFHSHPSIERRLKSMGAS